MERDTNNNKLTVEFSGSKTSYDLCTDLHSTAIEAIRANPTMAYIGTIEGPHANWINGTPGRQSGTYHYFWTKENARDLSGYLPFEQQMKRTVAIVEALHKFPLVSHEEPAGRVAEWYKSNGYVVKHRRAINAIKFGIGWTIALPDVGMWQPECWEISPVKKAEG